MKNLNRRNNKTETKDLSTLQCYWKLFIFPKFIICLAFLFYLTESDFAMPPLQSDYHADQFPEEKQPIPSPGRT